MWGHSQFRGGRRGSYDKVDYSLLTFEASIALEVAVCAHGVFYFQAKLLVWTKCYNLYMFNLNKLIRDKKAVISKAKSV